MGIKEELQNIIPGCNCGPKANREIIMPMVGQRCRTCGAESDSHKREIEMIQEIIIRLRKIHPPKYQHLCHEWDGMNICEYDPEFAACTCYEELKKDKEATNLSCPMCHWTGPESDAICVNHNCADPFEEVAGMEPCCPECQTYLGDE